MFTLILGEVCIGKLKNNMTTYFLFVYGDFEDHEDVEYFCNDIVGEIETINSLRYIIESTNSVIIIFESESTRDELIDDITKVLTPEIVKFYFVFRASGLFASLLPVDMKDFIFKPNKDFQITELSYPTQSSTDEEMDLDELLEKIDRDGVNSLTPEEKNFLDNYQK